MPSMRRRDVLAVANVAALAFTAGTSDAFIARPSIIRSGMRSKVPRTLAVRSLQMAGGPRGRSAAGISIEGADGAKAMLTSSTTTAIPSRQLVSEYSDDAEMFDEGPAGADTGLDDYSGFVSETQTNRVKSQREQTLSRKNNILLSGIVVAGIGAGAWVAGSAFLGRQKDLVEAYADEMTYHVGDEREMMLCDKEYKGKVGPGLYRETMFKAVMLAVGRKRAMTLDTVRSVKYLIKLYKFNAAKAAKLIVAATRTTDKSQSNVRSKLYFLGTLISMGNAQAEKALEPLKRNIEGSFHSDGAEMLEVRMDNMAESALKTAIESVPDDQVLESGWEELGISDERAAEIAGGLEDGDTGFTSVDFYKTGGAGTGDEESDPEAAAMLQQLETEMEEKKTEPQDEKEPEAEGTAKSYECQVCGYKMFVARGREFKFFGDNFKCPECGAGKNKFTEGEMGDD